MNPAEDHDAAPFPMRLPPQSIPAEVCVLGAMMLSPSTAAPRVSALLRPDDFYRPAHQTIYAAMQAMLEAGTPIDVVTVCDELERHKLLAQVGGMEYLGAIVDGVPAVANAEYYARTVLDKSRLRQLIVIGTELAQDAFTAEEAGPLLAEVQQKVYEMATDRGRNAQAVPVQQAVHEAAEHADDVAAGRVPLGIPTGFHEFDQATGGFQAGDLWTLAGGTSAGKTALALNIAALVAHRRGTMLMVSGEMNARAVANRILQADSGIRSLSLRTSALDAQEYEARCEAIRRIEPWRMSIVARSMTVGEIGTAARQLAARYECPLSLIIVDYLGLMKPSGGRSRAEQISGIAWGLKELAMDMGVAVLELSQLNREGLKELKPPSMYALKESGDVENHSNVVILLHRPPNETPHMNGDVDVWARIAKCRDGRTTPWFPDPGYIMLRYRPSITRFEPAPPVQAPAWEYGQ